ncbi:MAG: hypothetical protein WBX25_29060 [Rhodomicrobium sp.]
MWTLEADWMYCPDGVKLIGSTERHASPRPLRHQFQVFPFLQREGQEERDVTEGTIIEDSEREPDDNRYFIPVSKRRAPMRRTLENLEIPLCMALLNARDEMAIVSFFSWAGLPRERSYTLGDAMKLQRAVETQIEIASSDRRAAVSVINQQMLRRDAVVKPRLSEELRISLTVPGLMSFMIMEIAAIVEADAKLTTCEYELCGKKFLTGPHTNRRSTARFHSDKCRVYALREKMRSSSRA